MGELTALGGSANPTACEESKRKASLYFEDAAKWLRYVRWVGLVTALATAALVVFALSGADVARNVSAIGTVVGGAGFAFVITQRNGAIERYNATLKDMAKYCPAQEVALFVAQE